MDQKKKKKVGQWHSLSQDQWIESCQWGRGQTQNGSRLVNLCSRLKWYLRGGGGQIDGLEAQPLHLKHDWNFYKIFIMSDFVICMCKWFYEMTVLQCLPKSSIAPCLNLRPPRKHHHMIFTTLLPAYVLIPVHLRSGLTSSCEAVLFDAPQIPAGMLEFHWNWTRIQWIPAKFKHSCRNSTGIQSFFSLYKVIFWDTFTQDILLFS